ncbi:NAD+ diphosphatase [Endobacter medicaginis]|uniref:NAD(+) diphosphatase n=1 Tax=Endobacter medicaginis TaxID=1181271 RepID=A0A850NR35_9PROT|nr:NAD(+) diphosphatase [Endobacter medicaginis]MBB3172771.1 NAD+ diphosphatase [Endobacter medicaginis]MCX5474378.1 NAD(+) diphosphatase [Endobacter medicaginis]NVN30630.1 NAD(+) diphosphatase [Endobacter medicaginis]
MSDFFETGTAFVLDRVLDRAGNERRDAEFAAGLLQHPSTLFVVLRAGEPLLHGTEDAPALRLLAREDIAIETSDAVFLGLHPDSGRAIFALAAGAAVMTGAGWFAGLRVALLALTEPEAALVAHAAALLHWRAQTRFCSFCGHGLEAPPSGLVLHCPSCGRQHFARTDPAVIMLVRHRDADGIERALLARSPRFGERRVLSTLAGFVEPGERLEDAVRREVAEEVGVAVGEVRYHSSQPWPFPAQIMLGFTALAEDRALTLDPEEITEAHWLTRAEIVARRDAAGAEFMLPGTISIARRLIEDWLAAA